MGHSRPVMGLILPTVLLRGLCLGFPQNMDGEGERFGQARTRSSFGKKEENTPHTNTTTQSNPITVLDRP